MKADGGAEAKSVLWLACKWLGLHKSAYDFYPAIDAPKDRKQQRKLLELKEKAATDGDDFAVKPRRPLAGGGGQTDGSGSPTFRYFPDPLGNGALAKAEEGEEIICPCCGKATEYYYAAIPYCRENVENLCPACIASGAAAKKFDCAFVQGGESVSNAERQKELFERTPGYISWQGEYWLAHCDDYMEYLGEAGTKELKEAGIFDEVIAEYATHNEYDAEGLGELLVAGGSVTGYLFRCLHCGTCRIWVDAD
ncbi:MAG: CbrC family protein [Deltaproteobacteria bacterium]|nr:CbrC family protein [Deltaproteobacteria bacterium]